MIARKEGTSVRLWTRQANEVTGWFSGISAAIAALPVQRALTDGEAIVLRPDGHSDFHALRSRAGAAAAIMVAFDLVEHGWRDLRKEPVGQRREALQKLTHTHPALTFSQDIEVDGPMIFDHA